MEVVSVVPRRRRVKKSLITRLRPSGGMESPEEVRLRLHLERKSFRLKMKRQTEAIRRKKDLENEIKDIVNTPQGGGCQQRRVVDVADMSPMERNDPMCKLQFLEGLGLVPKVKFQDSGHQKLTSSPQSPSNSIGCSSSDSDNDTKMDDGRGKVTLSRAIILHIVHTVYSMNCNP